MADIDKSKEELIQELNTLHQRVAQLEAAEERFFNLFEYAGDSIFIVDPATFRVLDANANAARRLGYSHEELFTLTLDDIEVLTYDDFPGTVAWESMFSGMRVYECHYRRKDGFKLPVEVSSQVVQVGNNKVLQNFVRDITKRKQIEANLKDAHDRLFILSQVDAELTRRLDVHYVLTRALDTAVRLSGAGTGIIGLVERDQVRLVHGIGKYAEYIGMLLPQDGGIVARVLSQRKAELVLNVHADPDYTARIPETRAQMALPLVSQQRLLGVLNLETRHPDRFTSNTFEFIKLLVTRIAVALDNAYAYEELGHLVEDLDAFAHTVAHDLKNPVNTILGYASLLADDFEIPAEQAQEFLDSIVRGGRKMVNIIDELLLLASVRKLEDIEKSPLKMDQIVSGAVERLGAMIDEYYAEIHKPDEWPVAAGYAPWIEEIWTNYISNAIKYGGTPPVVDLGATVQNDGAIRFWVKDNGPGIEPQKQQLLFNQFTRLDETRAEGHGLGLSIVQRIMQKLGGQVSVESPTNQGSTFSFTLPAP